jgi:hypothetical protein
MHQHNSDALIQEEKFKFKRSEREEVAPINECPFIENNVRQGFAKHF